MEKLKAWAAPFLLGGILLGLLWLAGAMDARAQTGAHPNLPSRMLLGTDTASVQQLSIERCVSMGWTLEQSNPNQTVCSHEASTFANMLNTTGYGQGRPPRWFYVVTAAQIPSEPAQTLVTIDLYFQTYTYAGAEGRRDPMNREARRQAENALRDLATRLCTQDCP